MDLYGSIGICGDCNQAGEATRSIDYLGVLGFLEGPVMLPEEPTDQWITLVFLDS